MDKVARIKAVRELSEIISEHRKNENKFYESKQLAHNKLSECGFENLYDVEDWIYDNIGDNNIVGLNDTKDFVEKTFPEIRVEGPGPNNFGRYDSLQTAISQTVAHGVKGEYYFYQVNCDSPRIAKLIVD